VSVYKPHDHTLRTERQCGYDRGSIQQHPQLPAPCILSPVTMSAHQSLFTTATRGGVQMGGVPPPISVARMRMRVRVVVVVLCPSCSSTIVSDLSI